MKLPYRWKWCLDQNLRNKVKIEFVIGLVTELTRKQSDENLNKIRNHVVTRSSDFEWGDEERDILIKELDKCIVNVKVLKSLRNKK
mgnify:FL=1|tara:strand:- start:1328 stop:1585 length:258 start_codon:yes stop_codon:yes gene_type:complete